MRTTKDLLDPAVDVCISYLCGRHACSLLHSGGIVIGTVYDDRIVVSSDERWPLPRADTPWVAVPCDRDERPVQRFGAFTADLYALAEWLRQCQIETIVLESTGVYA